MAVTGGRRRLKFPPILIFTTFILAAVISGSFASGGERCADHNGRPFDCVPLMSCTQYEDWSKQRPLLPKTVASLRRLQCGFSGNRPKVCCPGDGRDSVEDLVSSWPSFLETTPSVAKAPAGSVVSHPNWELLDSSRCGADLTYRIFGGEEAQIGEYPWMALLEYHMSKKTGLQFLCGGALISDMYVLTAAHCLDDFSFTKLVGVRLGEHNIDTDPDCEEYSDGGDRCAERIQRRRIAEAIKHPKFRNQKSRVEYDIALIRMNYPVRLTDYVVPICLPNGALLEKEYVNEPLYVAGWGRTEYSSLSKMKLWIAVPAVPNQICKEIYGSHLTLSDDQMCAGGQIGKDACVGDSGGPLMAIDDVVPDRKGGQYVAIAIVTSGPVHCAQGGKPGIYTRVSPHMGWLLDNLKP